MARRTIPCPYCGELQYPQSQLQHSRSCLDGPAGHAARAFMLENAVNGYGMGRQEYSRSRHFYEGDYNEPPTSWEMIRARFGTWERFVVEFCGLRYRGKGMSKKDQRQNGRWSRIGAVVDAEIAAAQAASTDYDGILVINRGIRPVWNWRTMQADECAVLELK